MNKQKHFPIMSLIFIVLILMIITLTFEQKGLTGKAFNTPVQVYGEITPSMPDGTLITFKTNNVELASTYLNQSKYGYDEKIYLSEIYQRGNIVSVFIEDVKIAETTYLSSMPKNFIIPVSKRQDATNKAAIAVACISNWECSEWSSCIDNKETKTCVDLNDCRIKKVIPNTERDCFTGPQEEIPVGEASENKLLLLGLGALILIVFITLIILDIKRVKRRQLNKMLPPPPRKKKISAKKITKKKNKKKKK